MLPDQIVPLTLQQSLLALPPAWALCRVDSNKRPIGGLDWYQNDCHSPAQALALVSAGQGPKAWGLLGGPASNVLVLDLDDTGWRESFQQITHHSITDLPPTISWSSGTIGRSGHAFTVHPSWWSRLANRRAWKNAAGRTCWELRGNGTQSVILGAHPSGRFYEWLPCHSPADLPPSPAPVWLLEVLLVAPPAPAPLVPMPPPPAASPRSDADRARAMLAFISPVEHGSYDGWLQIGMALHAAGADATDWIRWSAGCPNQGGGAKECEAKWKGFKAEGPITIGTLHHLASKNGYHDPKRPAPTEPEPSPVLAADGPPTPSRNGNGKAPALLDDEEDAAAEQEERRVEIQSFMEIDRHARSVTPSTLFPPGLANAIVHYAKDQQLEAKGFYLPILCSVAALIGNRAVSVPQKGDELIGVPILWGMNIGSVSTGKSPTTKPTIEKPLLALHIKERDKHRDAIKQWSRDKAAAKESFAQLPDPEQEMAEWLADNPQPERRHILGSDTTTEKLEIILASEATPGILVFHDEMAQWFAHLCRNADSSDRPKMLKLRNGSAILTDRVNREDVVIANPACSVFGNLQPKRVAGLWKADLKLTDGHADGDGLWARFSYVCLPDWDYTYRPTTARLAPVLQALYKQVDAITAALPPPADGDAYHQLPLAADALPLYAVWTENLLAIRKARIEDDDRGYIDKQRGVTLTLALLLHAINQASCGLRLDAPISAATLEAAIQLNCLLIVERDQVMAPLREGEGPALAKQLLRRGREWREEHGSVPVTLNQIRTWRLPTKETLSKPRREWLEGLVASTPGMGSLVATGRSIAWLPPEL